MEKLLDRKTLMISTRGLDGEPAISYAPFVQVEGKFYIYLSKAAEHYHNIEKYMRVAIMMIQDEADTQMQFARERLSFKCNAKKLEIVDDSIWNKFDERFSAGMMNALRGLDFDMFELEVLEGRLVQGFGKAFNIKVINNEWQLEAVAGKGHRSK